MPFCVPRKVGEGRATEREVRRGMVASVSMWAFSKELLIAFLL